MHFRLPCYKIRDMVEIVYNRNGVYQTAYRVIWCPKYRKRILTGGIADAVKILKGSTAGKLFAAFQALKDLLYGGHLWSPSYYVGTAGNVSAESIRHYIERTEHIKGRR